MRKEWLLTLAVTLITIVITVTSLRFYAPQLLGIPADLQLVQVSKEVVPFFDGIFREEDRQTEKVFLEDPYLRRQKPFYPAKGQHGPHDLLGFRNASIPNNPDIITIGDSQTYGGNVSMAQSWPYQLRDRLGHEEVTVYNMGVHGWGATEYSEIFKKAVFFSPKVVIVAFYTGNDPVDSYWSIYGDARWSAYRPNQALKQSDYPEVKWPPPRDELEFITLANGQRVGFTPKLRHVSNMKHPAVTVAYEIMVAMAQEIGKVARQEGIPVIFTIIPTKELAFSKRIHADGIKMSQAYNTLVNDERARISYFSAELKNIAGCQYVDIVANMQEATSGDIATYKPSADGHPVAYGYNVIARALSRAVQPLLDLGPLSQ